MDSKCWSKLGNIKGLKMPAEILNLPHVIDEETSHHKVVTEHTDFWLQSTTWYKYKVLCKGSAITFLESLNLPEFRHLSNITFMSMRSLLNWHVDRYRTSAINIAIQNSSSARVDFEDGSSYVMEDGDVYSMDVMKRHRIVFDEEQEQERIVLSISLHDEYWSEETQNIISILREHLANRK